jgi:hypothetical protein
VLKPSSTQLETYDVVAWPIILDVLDGSNGVIMLLWLMDKLVQVKLIIFLQVNHQCKILKFSKLL